MLQSKWHHVFSLSLSLSIHARLMEHGMGLFYFCIERTQRDRIDTNLGAQALLGHTNSPIEKCRSCTMLADRLPRYDLCAFLCVVCGRARVRISESV